MTNKTLLTLAITAAAMVAIAVLQSNIANKTKAQNNIPRYLIQGLDPDSIDSITVGLGDDQVILKKIRTRFVLASKDNYLVNSGEINQLITNCLDVQPTEFVTSDAKNHKDLGVTEKYARYVVKFFSADANMITGVIVGNLRKQGRGTYLRRVDDDKVYVSPKTPWIKRDALDYFDKELTNVEREKISSVTISSPNDVYTLISKDGGKNATLEKFPQGKKVTTGESNKVWTALASLSFDDVRKYATNSGLDFDHTYTCKLYDSTIYTFRIAEKDGKYYARCDAAFTDKAPVEIDPTKKDSQEELKAKEVKLLAQAAAEDFVKKHAAWVYEISAYRAGNMTKPLDDIVEDLPKLEPELVDIKTEPALDETIEPNVMLTE